MDFAHQETDKMLSNLEKELNQIYKKTYFECKSNLTKNQKLIDALNSTDDLIKRNNLLRKKNKLDTLLKQIMLNINSANEIAVKMINNDMVDVYWFNYAYLGYTIEKELNARIGFQVFNQNVIKKLLQEELNPFTIMAIDNLKDKSNVYMQLKRELATGLLQGENITKLAKRMEKVLNVSHNSSITMARTETTRIEGSARMDSFQFAKTKGIKVKKEWISTIDKRTRKSHRRLMGEVRDLDQKFSNGLMYPGDPNGKAEEVIKCRCTMVSKLVDLEETRKELELDEKIKKMSFEQWGKEYAKS